MNARSPAGTLRPPLRDTLGRWGARAESIPDAAELRRRLEEQVRARPMLSVVLGATAGFLIGRLLRD